MFNKALLLLCSALPNSTGYQHAVLTSLLAGKDRVGALLHAHIQQLLHWASFTECFHV